MPWACWGVIGLVWALGGLLARQRGPAVREQQGRDLASLLGVVAAVAAVVTPESLWRPLTFDSPWVRVLGLVLLLVTAPCVVWSRVALGLMWSSGVAAKEGHVLRTTGPYRITRHPIYSAILAMLAATALSQGLGRWAAVFAAMAVVVVVTARAEERLLLRAFPDEYERYRRQVPRLVPLAHSRQQGRA